jgi:hypothetical protein
MTSLTESITAIESELTEFDAATTQLETTQSALAQSQTDLETLLVNTSLPVAERASQAVLLKATAEVLQSDVSQQTLALAALRKQIIADATALQSNLRGELGSKISALTKTTVAQLQTDFDPKHVRFPLDQIAIGHRDVLALRSIENSLRMYAPNDSAYIDFARGSRALLHRIEE